MPSAVRRARTKPARTTKPPYSLEEARTHRAQVRERSKLAEQERVAAVCVELRALYWKLCTRVAELGALVAAMVINIYPLYGISTGVLQRKKNVLQNTKKERVFLAADGENNKKKNARLCSTSGRYVGAARQKDDWVVVFGDKDVVSGQLADGEECADVDELEFRDATRCSFKVKDDDDTVKIVAAHGSAKDKHIRVFWVKLFKGAHCGCDHPVLRSALFPVNVPGAFSFEESVQTPTINIDNSVILAHRRVESVVVSAEHDENCGWIALQVRTHGRVFCSQYFGYLNLTTGKWAPQRLFFPSSEAETETTPTVAAVALALTGVCDSPFTKKKVNTERLYVCDTFLRVWEFRRLNGLLKGTLLIASPSSSFFSSSASASSSSSTSASGDLPLAAFGARGRTADDSLVFVRQIDDGSIEFFI